MQFDHSDIAVEVPISAAQSASMERLSQFEQSQLSRGLMRTDGGGPDTPFDMHDILRHFQDIAFYDEYDATLGFSRISQASHLEKWTTPVRFNPVFGKSVDRNRVKLAKATVAKYVKKLSRITGHPMLVSARKPNFDVLFMGHDDRDQMDAFLASRGPQIGALAKQVVAMMPEDVHCMVMAFSNAEIRHGYTHAIAIIRAEHPPLMQRACIEEELAQGLGLANDSPYARPSIFNDDDEFATLTTMDAVMLQILYDPRLLPGMTLDQARPYLYEISELLNEPQS
ncbi:MAG: DUF2927 domain-containing protein [Rhodobacteraceae bacterium]|jgi:hypothetical protein|nr:DUF2927 domain-containing protein [Paracoccaceae bacterium]